MAHESQTRTCAVSTLWRPTGRQCSENSPLTVKGRLGVGADTTMYRLVFKTGDDDDNDNNNNINYSNNKNNNSNKNDNNKSSNNNISNKSSYNSNDNSNNNKRIK
jgi:hypothetical protein